MILVQNGTGNHAEMLRSTAKHHATICGLNGFEYRATFESFPVVHPNWSKVSLIRKTLAGMEENDLLIYLDCDTYIRNSARLADILPSGFELGMAKKCGEKSNTYRDDGAYNAGIIAMRNTPAVRSFWAEVEASGPIAGIEWHDQETICEVLASHSEIPFLELDRAWNDYRNPPSNGSYIWAWHGLGNEATRRRLESLTNA